MLSLSLNVEFRSLYVEVTSENACRVAAEMKSDRMCDTGRLSRSGRPLCVSTRRFDSTLAHSPPGRSMPTIPDPDLNERNTSDTNDISKQSTSAG